MLRPKKFIPSLAIAMMALSGCGDDNGGNGGQAGNGGGTGGAGGIGGAGGAGGGAAGGAGGMGGTGRPVNVCANLEEAVLAFCTTVEAVCPGGLGESEVPYCVEATDYSLAGYLGDADCEEALTSYFCCVSNASCEDVNDGLGCTAEEGAILESCDIGSAL